MPSLILAVSLCLAFAGDRPTVLLVVGAGGSNEYSKQFHEWAGRWQEAARQGKAEFAAVGLDEEDEGSDRERLRQSLADEATNSRHALWLVLIGHGTFDGRSAKFNLRGPDVTAD